MTHQNHQTNGASLEDCHTNFFALTELYGIKWRKLVWGECGGGGDGEEGGAPLSDPVISSYARCLAGDILCVWRRVPQPQPVDIYDINPPPAPPPPLSLRAAKELWIFWYGEEPDLNGLVAPQLIASQGDQGSWESGLSYECRSLLFKALHNLIERCLLSRDFVRLGKWFVQPYDGDEEDVGNSPWHLSFSFAFFLHGESTVCASVDVRQHPPVRTLTAKRLAGLNAPQTNNQPPPNNNVILAPFGLEATVTGREWSDSDAATARLLDAWRQLYPLEQGCGAVEVVCGGVRMRYPCPYALVAEMQRGARAPPGPRAHRRTLAHHARAALATPAPHQPAEVCYAESSTDKEDFVDPTHKTPCTCTKSRRRRGARPRPQPFHARARDRRAHAHALLQVPESRRGACSPGSCGAASPPPASPHHPPQNHQSTGGGSSAGGVCATLAAALALHTPAPTPDPLAPPTPKHNAPPAKHYPGDSPAGAGLGACPSVVSPACELAQRPSLPQQERALDPLEDEHELHLLYDYTTVHAWLEHPVKRFKSEDNTFREDMALGAGMLDDLYAGHDHTKMAAMPDHRLLNLKQEKQEPIDEKEYKNLFTSDGLCPTLKDLDQIFDNSDDAASGDESVRLLQMSTPPDSSKCVEEARARCVRPEELSKMFPTPPSLEAHAQPSPGFTLPDDATPAPPKHPGSPPPDPIEDWSYVFKPPTVYKYVGSSKYAPLTTLPSQLLPPVTLPASAVYRPRWQHDKREDRPDNRRAAAETCSDEMTTDELDETTTTGGGVKRAGSPLSRAGEGTPAPRAHTPAPDRASPDPATAASTPCSTSARLVACGPASPGAPSRASAAACPLLLNVLLADTVLNVFRDHNFASCTLCVCNAGPKMVGNIRGSDSATYLSGLGVEPPAGEDEPSRCTCGFSAVVNRRLSYRAGLFYEDELEITGMGSEGACGGALGGGVAGAVVAMCAAPPAGPASALARAADTHAADRPPDHLALNKLEYSDGGAAARLALRSACSGSCPLVSGACVHRWPFIGARAPRSSRDVVRLMRRLRPLLQDAIQKRCCGARMWDGVSGPLTWRQFHRLAGRGNEDLCEPQPVPPLLVGHDRDWVSLSPYALRHWERLSLEPYSYSRDVAYVVLAADGDDLTDPLRAFFRELSTAYESCRLGRHRPIARLARDGIVRTGAQDAARDGPAEEWAGDLPPGRLGDYLRAYADTLRTALVPQLAALQVDRALFEEPARPPPTPEHEPEEAAAPAAPPTWPPADEGGPPALVLYLVEPPAAAAHRPRALLALLRLAAALTTHLHHHNPIVKIISLEGVCETWGGGVGGGLGAVVGGWAAARALAFNVFSGARRLLLHQPNGKSLTGFGTAANANLFINNKDEKNRAAYKLFSPAWVLGGSGAGGGAGAARGKDVAEAWGAGGAGGGDASAVLFLAYCLSHDQRWLLAAATDARGELLDTAAINIHVPARSRRRRSAPARRLGLTKLMDFTLGVMSQAAQPWRLVVGRVGRIGHGELKGWSWLLSRKNLMRASNALREICSSCSVLYPSGVPCILSACLVSTEPDSCLRLMADRFTPDERFSQASIQSHLHTPRDVTATHILVFPTSATTQSNQIPFEPPMANGEDNDMNVFLGVDMGDEEMGEENMDLIMEDMLFKNMWQGSPRASPRRQDDEADEPGSPARHHHVASASSGAEHAAEQVGTVLQQPLALGYLVSTAPVGGMPGWWWAGCTHLRDACPAFLKNALHLHAASVHAADDFTSFTQRRDHNTHPLDSQLTTDVLRYVLEGYNALSWLALDGTTHDRLSCLPFHVQVLMQLYHTAAALG